MDINDPSNASDEIDDETYTKICNLLASGDVSLDQDDFEHALEDFETALDLIPEPISNWQITLHVLVAIGETLLFLKDYQGAHDYLAEAMYYDGAIGNPYIHLRLGQAQYELGNMRRAQDELVRAYFMGETKIFEGEDPKYFEVVKNSGLRGFPLF